MSDFFDDTLQGLIEAVAIEKGVLDLEEKENMPAPTYITSDSEERLIDELVVLRKKRNLSQSELAELAGSRQQAISRLENKEHNPSLRLFYSVVTALGYDLKIVKKE